MAWLLEKFAGDKIFAEVLRNACVKPMEKYMKLCEERNKYNKMFYDEACNLPHARPSYSYLSRSTKSTNSIV